MSQDTKLSPSEKRLIGTCDKISDILVKKTKGDAHEALNILASVMASIAYQVEKSCGESSHAIVDTVFKQMKYVLDVKRGMDKMH